MSSVTLPAPSHASMPAEEDALLLDLDIQVIAYPVSTAGSIAWGSDYLTCKEDESTCDGSDAC